MMKFRIRPGRDHDPIKHTSRWCYLFNRSSSRTAVTNVTEVQNVGLETGEGSFGVVVNDGSTANFLDGDAIVSSFEFSGDTLREAFDFSRGAVSESFDFSRGAVSESFGLVRDAVGSQQEAFQESLGLVRDAVGSQQETFQVSLRDTIGTSQALLNNAIASIDESQSGGAQRLLVFGGLALAAFTAFAFFKR